VKGLSFHSSLHSEYVKGGKERQFSGGSEAMRCSIKTSNAFHLKKKKRKRKERQNLKVNVFASKVMKDPEQDCVKQLGSKAFTGHTHIGHASALPAGSGHTEQGR